MSLKLSAKFIPLTALALITTALCPRASAYDWSDTFLGYRYGTTYREPANTNDISKNIVSLQHVDGYKYGSNFFNLDLLISDQKDPAAGGGGGAQEAYVVYRHELSLSKVTGISMKTGPIRDIGFTTGFDLNTKNDPFAALVRELWVGPTIDFNVPGFLSVGFWMDKEDNHNGIVGRNVNFDYTWSICSAWGIPIKGLPLPAVFKGFCNYIGPKGKDGFGVETKPELLLETAIMFDVGSLAGKKDTYFAGVGYQYWRNKFGNDAARDPSGGSIASVPQFEFEVHF